MRRKVLLSLLLLAVLILLAEFFVLEDYLPSIRASKAKRYYEKLKKQNSDEGRIDFNSILRVQPHNRLMATEQHAKAATVPIKNNRLKPGLSFQNSSKAMQLSSKYVDPVNDLKVRKVRKKAQIKMGAETKRREQVAFNGSRGQKRFKQKENQAKSRETRLENTKLILIYTPLFDEKPWPGIRNTFQFTHYRGEPCPVTNCSLTYKHRLFSRSDVVIFHGQDMPTIYELDELNSRRPKGQIWVYLVLENPSNSRETYYFEDMFNWTMTYEKNADIFLPYGSYTELKPGEKSPYVVVNPRKKDRLVVWTVSNCGGLRDWYVQELQNHIRVDIFGTCAKYVYQPDLLEEDCEKHTPECENLLKRYKFQLAFENGNCVDYLTEKYWGAPLDHGILPVVLGGANYTAMAIPGSYINALDFDSVKALADYLLYLDKNDTAYMEYFAWRKKYKVHGYLKDSVFNKHYPWTCNLCAKAQSPESKRYKSLSDLRNSATHCGLYENKLYEMVSPGGDTSFTNEYTQQTEIHDADEDETEDEEEDEDDEDEGGEEEVGEDEVRKDEGKGKEQSIDKNKREVGEDKEEDVNHTDKRGTEQSIDKNKQEVGEDNEEDVNRDTDKRGTEQSIDKNKQEVGETKREDQVKNKVKDQGRKM